MRTHKNIKYAALFGCFALGATLTSCNDWLTLYPMDKIVEENFWEDKRDLESVRNAAYTNMVSNDCMERYMVWGELRADNFKKNPSKNLSDNLQDILNVNLKPSNAYYNWSSFYATINYCNKVLEHGPEILNKDKSFSQAEWEGMRAEMVALRALNYFYLIRTFDAVPMVFQAINDDSEVKALSATPQNILMDSLVNQMEEVTKTKMTSNYGSAADNKGLITDKAVHTILADMYLWRGSYYEATDKAKADSNYQACINHCDEVIKLFEDDYQKNLASGVGSGSMGGFPSLGGSSSSDEENPYHLIQNEGSNRIGLTSNAYDEIFGNKNSYESIFELQFDGNVNKNSLIPTYYRASDENDNTNLFCASSLLTSPSGSVDDESNSALFYKTDLRYYATIQPKENDKENYYLVKYGASSIDQKALSDNSDISGSLAPVYVIRTVNNANWIFYRLSDVLLMKAEAMCMIGTDLQGALELVRQVNQRSNPYATASDKLSDSKASSKEVLEGLILRERDREFAGEGKRWFDMVRYAMRKGEMEGPAKAFEIFGKVFEGTLQSTAKNKYKQSMQVMYSPYAESEMKANPLLVQNPIWDDQSTIQKK